MTTLKWVKKHIELALKQDETLDELRISLQSIITRLNLSPMEENKKDH